MTRLLSDFTIGAVGFLAIAGFAHACGSLWPEFGAQLGLGLGTVLARQWAVRA